MLEYWECIQPGEEVVLLPIGGRALPSTRVDLWDALLAREGVDLFGQRCLVATVRGVAGQSGRSLTFEISTANGDGQWPVDKVVRVEDLAPIGIGQEALERWLDSE